MDYQPATVMPNADNPHEGVERFYLNKGPLHVEVKFYHEGVVVDVWDWTDDQSAELATCSAMFTDCLNYEADEFYAYPADMTKELSKIRSPRMRREVYNFIRKLRESEE